MDHLQYVYKVFLKSSLSQVTQECALKCTIYQSRPVRQYFFSKLTTNICHQKQLYICW